MLPDTLIATCPVAAEAPAMIPVAPPVCRVRVVPSQSNTADPNPVTKTSNRICEPETVPMVAFVALEEVVAIVLLRTDFAAKPVWISIFPASLQTTALFEVGPVVSVQKYSPSPVVQDPIVEPAAQNEIPEVFTAIAVAPCIVQRCDPPVGTFVFHEPSEVLKALV